MFTKDKTQDNKKDMSNNQSNTIPSTNHNKTSSGNVPLSILSSNLNIKGDVICDGEIQLDGNINGDIKTKSLTIGINAQVQGEIISDHVKISGQVKGRITARIVELMESARIEGDVIHTILSTEAGSKVNGMLSQIDEKEIAEKLKQALNNDEKSDNNANVVHMTATPKQAPQPATQPHIVAQPITQE